MSTNSGTSYTNRPASYNNAIALNVTPKILNNILPPEKTKDFQNGLVGLGFLNRGAFKLGEFDEATKQATINFQTAFNLKVDGLAGIKTQTKLDQEIEKIQKLLLLKQDSFGNEYKDELNKLRKNPGFYGPATTALVKKWDEVNNFPNDGGTANLQTRQSLNKLNNDQQATTISKTQQTFLMPGDVGNDVKRIQDRLKELGYLNRNINTESIDEETANAVIAFQKANGLTVQKLGGKDAAVVGETTKKILFSNNAKKASNSSSESTIQTEEKQVLKTKEVQKVLEPGKIKQTAQNISVRINSTGTGIIVGKRSLGNNKFEYTVLTNQHVIDNAGKSFPLETSSGKQVKAQLQNTYEKYAYDEDPDKPTLDIAVIKFTSSENLEVAKTATAQEGEKTYSFGFPGGQKQPKFVEHNGGLQILTTRVKDGGYQIYSEGADIENGMSGGPLLNSQGQLIGINGGVGADSLGTSELMADGVLIDRGNRPGAIPIGMFIDMQTGQLRAEPNYNSVKGTWTPKVNK